MLIVVRLNPPVLAELAFGRTAFLGFASAGPRSALGFAGSVSPSASVVTGAGVGICRRGGGPEIRSRTRPGAGAHLRRPLMLWLPRALHPTPLLLPLPLPTA